MKRFVTLLFCAIGMLDSWPGIAGVLDSLKGSAEKLIDQQLPQTPPQLAIKAGKVSSVGVADTGKCNKIPYKWSQGRELLKRLRSENYFKVPYNSVSDDLLLEHIKNNSPAIIAELAKIDYGRDLQRYLNGQQTTLPNEAIYLNALESLVDVPKPLEYLKHLVEISIELNNVLASSVLSQSFETLNTIIVGIQVYRNAVGIFTRKREMLETYIWDRCGGTTSGVCKEGNSKDSVWTGIKETYSTYVERISEDTHIPIKPVDQLGNWFENAFSAYRLVAFDDSNSIRYVEGEAIARSAQALIPAKATEFSMAMLKNAEYSPVEWNSQDRLGEKLKLHNGKYYKRDEENNTGAIEFGESLDIEKIVLGDLNKDEKKDAAVILYHNTGGSGSVTQVAAVLNNNGQPQHVASRNLGDRTEIKSLAIKKGFIVITIDNPRFYPGQKKTVKYKLVGNKLVGPEPFH